MGGDVSVGYAYHGAAHPMTWETRKTANDAAEAATNSQSEGRRRADLTAVRGPEPNPRASIDSASWIDPSTLVSTTGTTISDHDLGPLGRHPRSLWASVT